MIDSIPITEARKRFLGLVDEVSGGMKKVLLTKRGRPAAILLSASEFYQMRETLDCLLRSDEVTALRKALETVEGKSE